MPTQPIQASLFESVEVGGFKEIIVGDIKKIFKKVDQIIDYTIVTCMMEAFK